LLIKRSIHLSHIQF